jgi:putative DNA methylase
MTYKKKLIEVALPLPEINDASSYDKMPGIGPHPKGIHHWWARLPLPSARAVLFASVVTDPEDDPAWTNRPTAQQDAERERLFGIVRRLMGKKLHEQPAVYAEAREEMMKHCGGKLPPVLDPFAGGGSIPLEAARLGFEAHAADLNPVAVLLNKCNLELAPRWSNQPPVNPDDRLQIAGTQNWRGTGGLAADVRYYSKRIRERAQEKIGELYPKVRLSQQHGGIETNVIAWIWARTVASPNPAAQGKYVPIISSLVLSTKAGNEILVALVKDESASEGWRFEIQSTSPTKEQIKRAKLGTRAGKAQDFLCFLTGTPITRSYIQAEGKADRLGMRLMAIVADGPRTRIYVSPDKSHEAIAMVATRAKSVAEARRNFLNGPLPSRAGITGGVCSAYGLNTWGHLFTGRQITALVSISDAIILAKDEVAKDARASGLVTEAASEYARTICTFLALSLDRCADFNNALCRWSSSNQKVMNLFARQALPMVWDFAEANVLGESVGAWQTCSEYAADCIEVLASGSPIAGSAVQADAAKATTIARGLLVSTDPPYYDNIGYAALSDFFYVWLRRSLGHMHPELFATMLAPKDPELTATPVRFDGDRVKAKEHFEAGFRSAFTGLREHLDPRSPLTVYYAFKQNDEDEGNGYEASGQDAGVDLTTGWETLLEALISSGFQITATWPVRASQKWRMVSMGTNALASYIVLACRSRSVDAAIASRRGFLAALKKEFPPALRHLQQGNIAPVDLAQAAIGPGMAVFSRYAKVLETDGLPMDVRTALTLINQSLDEVLAEQEGEFDADTRWAIAWFDQFGFDEGAYGVAETLSKAKNTSVGGMVEAGILAAKGGKVRLLKRDELAADWDPATDTRLTIWEITHHLIRRLEQGESSAAALLGKLGGKGEIARDLSYRLYTLCERRKRAQDAIAYNSLVLAWPDILRLSEEKQATTPTQGELI